VKVLFLVLEILFLGGGHAFIGNIQKYNRFLYKIFKIVLR